MTMSKARMHTYKIYNFSVSIFTMTRILVVGGGLTSAITASLLAKSSLASNLQLSVWDKARGCGGRMSTSRITLKSNASCTADLGAQYITATPEYAQQHGQYYEELKQNGILDPLKLPIEGMKPSAEGTIDYVCPSGTSSIVKHFFKKSGIDVSFLQRVSKIEKCDTKQWLVSTDSGSDHFDVVILTMPVPQILDLLADSAYDKSNNQSIISNLESVRYSARYALGLFYDSEIAANHFEKFKMENGACAKYIGNDSIFRYMSLDSYKRSNKKEADVCVPLSVVFHTSVPFGIQHIENTPDEVKPLLLDRIKELFPQWPEPSAIKCQKWKFSQVSTPYSGKPGCIKLSEKPLLLAGGDAFSHSNFDGCITSAEEIVKFLVENM